MLVLTLLADRVVCMFEDLLDRATLSGQARNRVRGPAWGMTDQHPPGMPTPPSSQHSLSSIQLDHSIRSAFDGAIIFSGLEGNGNGERVAQNYPADSEVKEHATKRLLIGRIRKLKVMLGDMGLCLGKLTGSASTGRGRAGCTLGTMLDGGRSRAVSICI